MKKKQCDLHLMVSDEENDATEWLIKTLERMHEKKGPNCERALAMRNLLARWGEHMNHLHDMVHTLEHVMHEAGLRKVNLSEVERITHGDLN